MGRVAVQPVRSHHGPGKGVELLAAEGVEAASRPLTTSIYIIQPVGKLPTVDVTQTVASVLVGRAHAQIANEWAVRLASQYHKLLYVMGLTFTVACMSLFMIEDKLARYMVSILSVAMLAPLLLIHGAALCWDILRLLVVTFEFWFLVIINIVDATILCVMVGDVRMLAILVGGAGCLLTVFLDANIRMRVLVLRLFIPGAVTLAFMTVVANLYVGSDIKYGGINAWGAEMKAVDVINSGMSTIAFFMVTRVFRYRSSVCSYRRDDSITPDGTISMIQCDIYFPICRLVRYEEWNRQRRTSVSQSPRMLRRLAQVTQLELVERDQLRIIDARDTIASLQWCQLGAGRAGCRAYRLLPWILNAIGVGGCAGAIYLSAQEVVSARHVANHHFAQSSAQWHITACAATALFVLIHIAYFQRELFRRICVEIDAWFVSFQASFVAFGACDVFFWDKRSLLVATAWIWCHWMLFLDALPPVVRARLGLSRIFIVLVSIALLAFPLWLGYMTIYAPNATTANRNRTILEARVGHIDVRMEMLSLLLSRIFTLWVWMGRFFWREVLRPSDSFKLIKYRVHFPFC